MKVKMLINRVGVREQYRVGEEYDIPDGTAQAWIDQGKAQAVGDPVVVEAPKPKPKKERATATVAKETATKKDGA